MKENALVDKKSLRFVAGKNVKWKELAKDCVCFTNAYGGKLLIGIEDKEDLPPSNQTIPQDLITKLVTEVKNRTVNVNIRPIIKKASNGGEYIELSIFNNPTNIACTTDGKYYIRIADSCKPVMHDDLGRLFVDNNAFSWEKQQQFLVKVKDCDKKKLKQFLEDVQSSKRVSSFVKEKNNKELLNYYCFAKGEYLTNLGILWIGKRQDRATLLHAPIIQFIKYDEFENKVNKLLWDDFRFNPKEMLEEVWTKIPDWQESIEIADGIFRKQIFNYNEIIIRELVVNALVHRPYTVRGDIFINLFTDRLEIHNPGPLPLGITPENVLHQSKKRNEHLAKVFYDLGLMEREGSGYDIIYQTLLENAKRLPEVTEQNDTVTITIYKQIIDEEAIKLMNKATKRFLLTKKEVISLGLIAQERQLTSSALKHKLFLNKVNQTRVWLGRLEKLELIKSKGKTKGKTYFVNPEFLENLNFKEKIDLKTIKTPQLKTLIKETLKIHQPCSVNDIHEKIGKEIPIRKVRHCLSQLIKDKKLSKQGNTRATVYSISKS